MSDTTTPPPQFTSVIGDPFDPAGASNLHQPGFLGISPDVWRSLANFGSNMATSANARTSGGFLANGTGFAGPFAAAVGESNQQGLQRGQTLADINYRGALAQNQRMQNYVTAMNLPLQLAQNRMMLEMMQNPQAWAAKYGFGAPTISGGQTASSGGAGTASDWKPTFGGASDNLQPPKEYMPFYQEASARTGIPINVLIAQSRQESGFNPGATGSAGEIGLTQIKPATATNPGYGITGVQNPDTLRDPRTNILFGADYLKARAGNIDWTDPAQVATALTAYNGGGDKQYAQHVMRYIPATQQQTAAAQPQTQPQPQMQTAATQPPAANANPPPQDPSKMTDQEWLDWQSKTYPNLAGPGTQLPSESPVSSSPYQTASNAPVAPPSQPAPQQPSAGQPVGNLGLVRLPNGNVGTPAPQQAQTAPALAPQPQAQQQPAPQQPQQSNPQALRAQQFTQAAEQAEAQASQLEQQRSQINVENARRANFIKTLPPMMQTVAAQSPALQPLPMPPGDPAAIRTNAQQYREAALKLSQPISTREGIYDPITGKTIYRNPQLIHGVDPTTGQETAQWMPFNEDANGNPVNTNPIVTKLGPGQEAVLEEPSKEFHSEAAVKKYNSAVQTLGWTATMAQDFDALNNSGDPWSKTGPGAPIRMHVASTINDAFRSAGLPEVFNSDKIASWEALQKQTRQAGMQLALTLGTREAASVVQTAINSVPNDSQSPTGAKNVMNIIKEGAQYEVDRRNYIQQQAMKNGGNYAQPGLDFDAHGQTIQSYMRRAQSQTAPIQLHAKTPQEFYAGRESKLYLPGTLVRSASGTVFPIPDPNQQQTQGGNG